MAIPETPIWHYASQHVLIRKVCVGSWENNSYIVVCPETNAAVIIDAAAEPSTLLAAADGHDVTEILTTHGHFDHVGAAPDVAADLSIPWRIHPADAETFALTADTLQSGEIHVGSVTMRAIHTPGHTPGSTCFVVDDVLFSGDTLFPGGPGATRGPGADFATIMDSVDTLLGLPPETLVMPGHGLDTTIGTEAPHAAAWRTRGW